MSISGLSRQPASSIGYQQVRRILTASLPFVITGKTITLLNIFDLAFNLFKLTVDKQDYFTGAYCIYKITPGCLVKQSPLLAQSGTNYTFPGHPVSIKFISFIIHSTASLGSYAGKWAAVFIPFLEMHDDSHYSTVITSLTFDEISAMPHAVVGPTFTDLRIMYRMRDRTAYCARPRELKESIGLVVVAWDNQARDSPDAKPLNSQFNCEFELTAGFQPHVIFGPQHRVEHAEKVFKPICLTDGTSALDIRTKELVAIDWSSEKLATMELE